MTELTLSKQSFVVFDLETTGLYAQEGDEIIEVGALRVKEGEIEGEVFQSLVNPGRPIPAASTAIHGIKDEDVTHAPSIAEVLPKFHEYCGSRIWVAQNAAFDLSFIVKDMRRLSIPLRDKVVVDTMKLSKILFPNAGSHKLDVLMARTGIAKTGTRHRSIDDCKYTALVLIEFIKMLEVQGLKTLMDIQEAFQKVSVVLKPNKPKSLGLFT